MNRGTVSAEFQGKRYEAEWQLENAILTVSHLVLGEKSADLGWFRPAELARCFSSRCISKQSLGASRAAAAA
jgi:hypothetical protein